MSSGLTYITNEPGTTLRDRFGVLPGEDTNGLEAKIDELVHGFHGPTPEKIKIVEGTAQ